MQDRILSIGGGGGGAEAAGGPLTPGASLLATTIPSAATDASIVETVLVLGVVDFFPPFLHPCPL